MTTSGFDLSFFTPYLLNRAAEEASLRFQSHYKDRYGMLRTEWRLLFHLGHYGPMTAKEVCARAGLHKTKISRAAAALQAKRFLTRETVKEDRRVETLSLTRAGNAAFADLSERAQTFDSRFLARLTEAEVKTLRHCLQTLISDPIEK